MLRALLSRFLTVRESHADPVAPLDKFGNPKTRCEQCVKFVVGLNQHRKAMHGSPKRRRAPRIEDPDEDTGDNGWCIPPDMGAH